MVKKQVIEPYEIIRWQVGGILSRFHVCHLGDAAALCGDPIITTGEHFISRPVLAGRSDDPLVVMADLFSTKFACKGCVDAVSRVSIQGLAPGG